jgi:coenzyme F420 biosynthesis associated uncharacterized protein
MTGSAGSAVGRAVDWQFAGTVGARLARPGPPVTEYTRRQAIEDLDRAAQAAEKPVREVTGLVAGGSAPRPGVVNRQEWIRAAAESMAVMTGGALPTGRGITGRVAGAQTGAILAFVSSGILGQYDPFAITGADAGDGRLLLVYPNVIAAERQLRVPASDFRLWVCLHEVTHLVQFTANPWLAGHMSAALGTLTAESGEDVAEVARRLVRAIRGGRSGEGVPAYGGGILGLLRTVQSEPQREALDQLLVLGTLLEGHADHVMDAVGPSVVPSVRLIRSRFDQRRQRRPSPPQRLLRALLGLDVKLSQYTRGRAFVDEVVARVGMARFNAVWSGPQSLPLPDEIESPQRWIDRVL